MALAMDIRIRKRTSIPMRSSRRQRKKACYEILFMPLLGLHVTCAQRTIVVCGPHKKQVALRLTRLRLHWYLVFI